MTVDHFASLSAVLYCWIHTDRRKETGENVDTWAHKAWSCPVLFPSFLPMYLLTMNFPVNSFGWRKCCWFCGGPGRGVDVFATLKACFCNACLYLELLSQWVLEQSGLHGHRYSIVLEITSAKKNSRNSKTKQVASSGWFVCWHMMLMCKSWLYV